MIWLDLSWLVGLCERKISPMPSFLLVLTGVYTRGYCEVQCGTISDRQPVAIGPTPTGGRDGG